METKVFNKWLKGKIVMAGYTQTEVAEWLCISQSALSMRIRGGDFAYYEMVFLFKKLKATDEEILMVMKGAWT